MIVHWVSWLSHSRGMHWIHRRSVLELALMSFCLYQCLRIVVLKRRLRSIAAYPEVEAQSDINSATNELQPQGVAGRSRSSVHKQPLSFEYADADGVVSDRTIINWTEDETYIEGLCLSAHANRTFRKDRVLRWEKGAERLAASGARR